MKAKTFILWVLLLTVIDLVIKLIIHNFFMETQFDIIPSLVEFKPIFNNKHSYVNSLLYKYFQVDIGLWAHNTVFVISQVIAANLYLVLKTKLSTKDFRLLDTAIILQLSAFLCILIGRLFWEEGILDYIYLKPLFIFDLKDVYLSSFAILFLLFAIKNRKQIDNIDLNKHQ